jgi:hypothetical protein
VLHQGDWIELHGNYFGQFSLTVVIYDLDMAKFAWVSSCLCKPEAERIAKDSGCVGTRWIGSIA